MLSSPIHTVKPSVVSHAVKMTVEITLLLFTISGLSLSRLFQELLIINPQLFCLIMFNGGAQCQ